MTAEEALETLFQNDYTNSDSSPNDIHGSNSDIFIKSNYNKKQAVNPFITVPFPNLSLRQMMRSMQVQIHKTLLLQLMLKLIFTHLFKMINQYM